METTATNPKVTIVIPVYNGAKYIKYALESAIAQTYDNLEILVVNDGSTDKTEEIIKPYIGKKVRYIKKENGGVSTALNLALDKMEGEYFSWLSHDDTYEPNKIEREIEFLKENNWLGKKVIVFSDYYLIDKNGKLIAEAKKDHEETVRSPEYNLLKGHINGLSLLIPKTAFDDFGKFDTELSCAQDYEMWRRMMKKYKFVHLPEALVSTRWHKKQTTQTSPKVLTEGNKFYSDTLAEIPEKRMEELEGSRYNFLIELAKFHKNSVYTEFSKQCEKQAQEILEKAKDKVAEQKVSIIIPFYNRSAETQRAIKSVLKQTHKNIEIILINDGSEEDVSGIEKMAKKHNLVLLKNEKNSGASVARNLGIRAATGDYIAFLDSDDEFLKDKLEVQLQYMVASKAKISHTSYIKRTADGDEEIIDSGKDSGKCARQLMCGCRIATPTVIIDRKWLQAKDVSFNPELGIGEDTCFWLELLKDNTCLTGIDLPLSRVNVNDTSAAYNIEKQAEGLKMIIRYLVNDSYYSQFDTQLAQIMEAYAQCVNKIHIMETEKLISGGPLKKFFFFMRQEGISSAGRRAAKKIKETIKK